MKTLPKRTTLETAQDLTPIKRLTALALSLLLAFTCALSVAPAVAEVRSDDVVYGQTIESRGLTVSESPSIDAEYALVMDSNGTIYFERNAYDSTQIASITKVMTAIVALDAVADGTISLDTVITVSTEAASVGESSAYLWADDTLTLEAALYALLIPSGNDAAVAIAEAVAGSVDDFVELMNEKAEELGLTDTYFENPHGLDSGTYAGDQHSCAADVAVMVQYAMTNETFRTIVATSDTTITVTRSGETTELTLSSTDGFIDLYEYAIGVKTGYTNLAGWSFAGAALMDGIELYVVVINSTSDDQRFEDAQTLCEWVYDHLVSYSLINTTKSIVVDGETYAVVAQVAHSQWTNKTVAATVADEDATLLVFDLNGNVSQSIEFYELTGDIKTGDVVGTITFKQHNEVIATLDLIACEDVDAPGFFERIGVWFKRLVANFTGSQKVATSVVYNEMTLIVDKTS